MSHAAARAADGPMIAPNLLASNLAYLAREAQAVTGPPGEGADWLHVDVMDGHFAWTVT